MEHPTTSTDAPGVYADVDRKRVVMQAHAVSVAQTLAVYRGDLHLPDQVLTALEGFEGAWRTYLEASADAATTPTLKAV